MSQQDSSQAEESNVAQPPPARPTTLLARLVPAHIQHIFTPGEIADRLLPDEEIELEIFLSWYRNMISLAVMNYTAALFFTALAFSLISGMLAIAFGYNIVLAMSLPFILLIALVGYGLFERFQYLQWRLVKTNNRIIFYKPQSDAWYLVDDITFNGQPRVIDANWSDNQARRLLQALTGARDLYVSLQGLQFVQGTARVQDAIVIPDVAENDIQRLKELVFQ